MADYLVIALFRHGLTEENKRKAYLGWNDSPLVAESLTLATKSAYERYFSSDLKRCLSTAALLFPNQKVVLLKDFREMDFGKWQGKTFAELKDDKLYQQWIAEPLTVSPPEGESFQQFSERVDKGWSRIMEDLFAGNVRRCAVITHGGVIKYLLAKFAPEKKEFWNWQVPHGYGIELVFDRESLRRGERCTLLREVPITGKEHG